MKKQMIILVVAMIVVFNSIGVYAAEKDITILINDSLVISEVDPFIEDGTTYVPIRFVAENLGAEVNWIDETKTVEIIKEGIDKIVIDEPNIVNGSTFVPLRFVAENLNCTVDWDGNSKTITIREEGFVPESEMTDEELIAKYTALSEKAKTLTEDNFDFVPVTDYCPMEQVPQDVEGSRFDKISYITKDDLPLKIYDTRYIYDFELDTLDNGVQVLSVTMRVSNRNIMCPLVYATKQQGLLVKRDSQIQNVYDTIVQIGKFDYIVKHKYHIPYQLRDNATLQDVEYIVFYNINYENAVAIKSPYYKK